jgi:outer membrane protein OmpA-like peptidoglycan-associated protein
MNEFRGDTLTRVASSLGESSAKTETALGVVLPALMGGLASKGSTSAGAVDLLDLIKRNKFDSRQYGDISSAISAPDGLTNLATAGRSMLDSVFGTRGSSVTDWIASFAGINRSSSTSLLSLALPLVIGQITKFLGSNNLNAASLQNLLADQKTFLKDAPAGLTAALGLGDVGRAPFVSSYESEPVATHKARAVGTYETETGAGSSWWKWALPLLLLALVLPLYFAFRGDRETRTVTQAPPRSDVPTGTVGVAPVVPALGEFVERRLPRNITIRVPARGVESKLIAFIEDPNVQVDKETWFTFDRLEFETDSALLKPSSREQLRNTVEILRAYPAVHVKIGGYTDNVGDDAYNMKLSSERATATMNDIVSQGTDRSRIEAEGYGENHPIADNGTAEGRQRNRRIDIRVTKK